METGRVARRPVAALSDFQDAVLAFLQAQTARPAVPIERRLFLTIAECAEFSGLPASLLRTLIAAGTLPALRTGSGWRIARSEMETLAGTLTHPPEQLSDDALRDMEINRRRRQGLGVKSDNVPVGH